MEEKNIKKLLVNFGFFFIVYLSWLSPVTRPFWDVIDTKSYLFFNSWIQHSSFLRNFWAMMNHGLTDWLFDVVMLAFVLMFIFQEKTGKSLRSIKILLCVIFCAFVILSINRYLISELFHVRRLSPSLVVDGGMRLSHEVHWLKIKETHHACFPGDHGTTALLFSLVIFYLMGNRMGLLALLVAIFFCLPRLIVGAHWLTDIAIGSFSIALLSLSLFFHTGFFGIIIKNLFPNKKIANE